MRAKHKHCAPASWPMEFINDNNLRLCPHCHMPYVSQDGRHSESCQHNPNRLNTPDRRQAAQTTSTPAQSPRRPAVMPAAAAAGAAPGPATLAPQEVRARVPDGPPDMPNWPEAYNDQLKQWIDSQDHDETDLALCHTMRRVPSTAMLAWTTVHNYVLMQHLRYPDDPRILRLYSYLPRLPLQQKQRDGAATTPADIRRRCACFTELTPQTLSVLFHVPDDQQIAAPVPSSDLSTVRSATHLV